MSKLQSIATTEGRVFEPPARCVTLTRYFYSEAERPIEALCEQLHEAVPIVRQTVLIPLQDFQREALLCLVSDVVAGLSSALVPFERSFLVTAINRGMFQVAAGEFQSFCYLHGKIQPRIWEKRRAEQFLFARGLLLFETY